MPETNEKQEEFPGLFSQLSLGSVSLSMPSIISEAPQVLQENHHQKRIMQEVQQEIILKLTIDSLWKPN